VSLVPILWALALGLTFNTERTSLVLTNFWAGSNGENIYSLSPYSTATNNEIGEVTPNSISFLLYCLIVLSILEPE